MFNLNGKFDARRTRTLRAVRMNRGEAAEFNRRLRMLPGWRERRICFSPMDVSDAETDAMEVELAKLQNGLDVNSTDNHAMRDDVPRMTERYVTGFLGELAVERYLGIQFSDRTPGKTDAYSHADLLPAGYNVGVKTSMFPNFPAVNRNLSTPQIFVVLSREYDQAIILGMASPELMRQATAGHSGDAYIHMKGMLNRKTAFVDIDKLGEVSLAALEKYRVPERARQTAYAERTANIKRQAEENRRSFEDFVRQAEAERTAQNAGRAAKEHPTEKDFEFSL